MWKYAVAMAFCLVCLGVGIWGSVAYYPASSRAVVVSVAQERIETGMEPDTVPIVPDNATTVVSAPVPAAPASPVVDNYSSPTGTGVVHASFTVVG